MDFESFMSDVRKKQRSNYDAFDAEVQERTARVAQERAQKYQRITEVAKTLQEQLPSVTRSDTATL